MKETFETNLASSQKEEMANQKAYEELKAAKETEIQAGQEQLDSKTDELADTDEKLAGAKEDIVDTEKSLRADEQFLEMLKEKCSQTDAEWEERQKTRQLEVEAVSKALAVLTSDDAHDLLQRPSTPLCCRRKMPCIQSAAHRLQSFSPRLPARCRTLALQLWLSGSAWTHSRR
jgi:hypothetical protein